MAREKGPRYTTPFGTAVYPRLSRPDTKFDELGAYKADLRVPYEDGKPLMKKLAAYYKAEVGKAPEGLDNTMWVQETDEEGDKTGFVMFKLRVKNKMRRDGELWDRKPKLFDAAMAPCPTVNPWGGSVMAVNFEAYAWDTGSKRGVSLQPIAVQITELVEGGSGDEDAAAYGFGKEDGFSAPEGDAMAETKADAGDDVDEDDEDF